MLIFNDSNINYVDAWQLSPQECGKVIHMNIGWTYFWVRMKELHHLNYYWANQYDIYHNRLSRQDPYGNDG